MQIHTWFIAANSSTHIALWGLFFLSWNRYYLSPAYSLSKCWQRIKRDWRISSDIWKSNWRLIYMVLIRTLYKWKFQTFFQDKRNKSLNWHPFHCSDTAVIISLGWWGNPRTQQIFINIPPVVAGRLVFSINICRVKLPSPTTPGIRVTTQDHRGV